MTVHLPDLTPLLMMCLLACDAPKETPSPAPKPEPAAAAPLSVSDMTQYRVVCDGRPVANAAPFAKTPGVASPVAYFYKDDTFPADAAEFTLSQPAALRPWSSRAVAEIQLVACVNVTESERVRECPMNTGAVVELYTTVAKVTVREASTGKVVTEQTLRDDASERTCPTTALVGGDRQRDYNDLSGRVTPLIAEHQPEDAPPPLLPAWTFTAACSGSRALGADARSTAAGTKNPFAVFVREGEESFHYGDVFDYAFDAAWSDLNLKARAHGPSDPGVTLAVCMTATRTGKSKTCKYSGANLDLQAATWKVDLVAASTGEVIATSDFVGEDACPEAWNFSRGGEGLAEPGKPLADWLRPYVEPS